MKMLTVFSYVLLCVDTMWESEGRTVCTSERMFCVCWCVWECESLFFCCRKSWTLLHRRTVVKFHFCIEINFPSWSADVENKTKKRKIKDPVQSQDQSQMPRKKKKNRKKKQQQRIPVVGVVWHWQLTAGFTPPIVASAVSALYSLDGTRAAVDALWNSLEEAYANWCHRGAVFQLAAWTRGAGLCHCTRWKEHAVAHVSSLYTHWTRHHASSDLLEYHTTRQCYTPLDFHFGHALRDLMKELAWGVFDGGMRWMRWWGLCVVAQAHWENAHLPHLCRAPLDLLIGHAMLYDEGPVSIANTVIMYMQWRSCCLHHTGMWLACISFSSQCSHVNFEQ